MSHSRAAAAAAADYDSSDDDEMDLPVIAIDHLRAIVRPDQVRNRHEHLSGLVVRGRGGDEAELLFQVDEQDPLFAFEDEHDQHQERQASPLRITAAPERQQEAETVQQQNEGFRTNVAARSETLTGQALGQDDMQQSQQEEEEQHNIALQPFLSNQAPETSIQEQHEHEQKHDADSLERQKEHPAGDTIPHRHERVVSNEQPQDSREECAENDASAATAAPASSTNEMAGRVVLHQEQVVGWGEHHVVLHGPQVSHDDMSFTLPDGNTNSSNNNLLNIVRRVSDSSAILTEANAPPPSQESSNYPQQEQAQQEQDNESSADNDDDSEVATALNRRRCPPVHHALLNDRPVVSPPEDAESFSMLQQQRPVVFSSSTLKACSSNNSNNNNNEFPVGRTDYLPLDEERAYLDQLGQEIYQAEERQYQDALEASVSRAEEQEQLDAADEEANADLVRNQEERCLGHQVKQTVPKTQTRVQVFRQYPRFVGTKEMLSRSHVQNCLRVTEMKFPHDEQPKVALQESVSDENTWELAVSGLKHIVDQFLTYVDDYVRCSFLKAARKKLLLDGYKVEAYFDGSEELGATARQFEYKKNKTAVLWKVRSGKQFSRVLGEEAASFGSLLLAVDGKECTSRDDLKARITGAEQYRLALVVSGEADLSLMDKSRIVDGPCALSESRPQTLATPTNKRASTSQPFLQQEEQDTATPGLISPFENGLALANQERRPAQTSPMNKKRNALADASTPAKFIPRKKLRSQVPREGLLTSLIGGLGGFDKGNAFTSNGVRKGQTPNPSENSPLVEVRKELGTSLQSLSSRSSSSSPKRNVLGLWRNDPGNQEMATTSSSKSQETSPRQNGSEEASNAATSQTFSARHYTSPISLQSKDSRRLNGRKRVTFSQMVEERQYSPSDTPSEFRVSNEHTTKMNIDAAGSHNSERWQQSIRSLEKIVREGTHFELVKFLSRNEQTDSYSEDLFRKMRKIVAELTETATTSAEKECLAKKDKLLKIFIQAIYVAQQSKFTGKWERFEIKLKGIEGLRLEDPISALNGRTISGRVFSMKGKTREELHSIPPTPLTFDEKDSSYRLNFDPDMHSYRMNYNDSISNNRKVKIELRLRGGAESVQLGSVYIKLSELHKKCPPDREWKHLSVAATSSDVMIEANFNISARRTATDRNMVEEKRRGMLGKLKEVLDWIEQWNQENSFPADQNSPAMLSANIRAGEQVSLVHAALFLHDCELMERVLQLGGYSKAAFSLARNLADGTAEAYNEDGNVDPTDWKRSRRATIEKIVALLQQYSHKAADVQVNSSEEPAASKNMIDSNDSSDSPAELEASVGHSGALMAEEEIALPMLSSPSWATRDLKSWWLCKDWEKNHCCFRNTMHQCKYLHLHRPWGSKLPELMRNAKAFPLLDYKQECIRIKRDDTSGRLWFTAAYEDRGPGRTDQFIYYAEGGETARISKQGVSWYPTEEDAKIALYNVVEASIWAQRQGITPPDWQTKFNFTVGEQNSHASEKAAGDEYYGPSSSSTSPKQSTSDAWMSDSGYYGPSVGDKDAPEPIRSDGPTADAGYYGPSIADKGGNVHDYPNGNSGPPAHSRERGSPTQYDDWGTPPTVRAVEMPLLEDKWITNLRRKPCRYFPHDCRYGVKCHNAHFLAPMPTTVDYTSLPPFRLDEKGVTFLWKADNVKRQPLVTARYWDLSNNVVYYAQSGPKAYWDPVNKLWWYTSQRAALNGIMNAIHLAHECIEIENAKKRQRLN